MTSYHHGPWITTYTGKQFDFLDPQPDQIDIEDIAVSLSRTVRFRGHTTEPYTVAQHCVLATFLVPVEDRLWALLHDASEAYLGDMPKPVKKHLDSGYTEVENKILRAVIEKFGLTWPMPLSVERADLILLVTEAQRLMKDHPHDWHLEFGVEPDMNIPILPYSTNAVYRMFLRSFHHLNRSHHGPDIHARDG